MWARIVVILSKVSHVSLVLTMKQPGTGGPVVLQISLRCRSDHHNDSEQHGRLMCTEEFSAVLKWSGKQESRHLHSHIGVWA